jgi:hypothetical protein
MNLEQYNEQHRHWKKDDDQIRTEINFNTLTDDLCATGWAKVVLTPMIAEQSDKIDHWIDCNCIDQYKTLGLVWLFKNKKDAIMFTLVWA